MDISSSSPSTSSSSTPSSEKCVVCFQPAHGNHFGVDCCRACAAFFRRVFVTHKQRFKCRNGDGKCLPDSFGRWLCKRCRTDRCFELGMKPDNIQRNRDRFVCSESFHVASRKRTSRETGIPMSVDQFLGKRKTFKTFSIHNEHITFFDLSPILSDADYILKKWPKNEISLMSNNSLGQLAHGLREVRKAQVWTSLPEMRRIGKTETWESWVEQMRRASRWIMYFDKFRELQHDQKFEILKCMWHLFNRLERMAMTAEMRRQKVCKSEDYVFSLQKRINFNLLEIDSRWFTELNDEEIRRFTGPLDVWFADHIIKELVDLQPSDEELAYMLCNLCFYLAGTKLSDEIKEEMDKLQDILANDLHEYYLKKDKYSRYSYRLSRMLALNRQFQNAMAARRHGIFLAHTFNVIRVQTSHPEMFFYSV